MAEVTVNNSVPTGLGLESEHRVSPEVREKENDQIIFGAGKADVWIVKPSELELNEVEDRFLGARMAIAVVEPVRSELVEEKLVLIRMGKKMDVSLMDNGQEISLTEELSGRDWSGDLAKGIRGVNLGKTMVDWLEEQGYKDGEYFCLAVSEGTDMIELVGKDKMLMERIEVGVRL